jgi:hypothetical protein
MTICSDQRFESQLRAPREDRSVLVDPPGRRLESIVQENVRLRAQRGFDFLGRSLEDLSRQARRELIADAVHYTSAYRDVACHDPGGEGLLFLAGHQPQLFHPGVWFKNVALATLASRCGATAVNLLIDSDTMKSPALRVPGGSLRAPRLESIPLDASGPVVPYEERRIVDRPTFTQFGRRAAERIAPLIPDPMLADYWPLAVERSHETENLGLCLAQSRHQWEARWGLGTLELPQSHICRGEPFCWFVAYLLAHLPRLHAIYNDVVAEYRKANKIRSSAHPVPDLGAADGWLEAPLWVWTRDNPTRRGLWAISSGDRTLLSDRQGLDLELPLAAEADAGAAARQLVELQQQGVRLRSRALITTLWSRLALGDLFLHGIGGGKYDRVTDALICRFLDLQPPQFMVLSGTLLLPVPRPEVSEADLRHIDRQMRDLRYHAEKALNAINAEGACSCAARPRSLIASKRRWIETPKTPQNARQRHEAIEGANLGLQPWVEPQRRELQRQRQSLIEALRARSVLAWREYAFCLYPEAALQDFLFGVLPKSELIRSDE